MNRSALQFVVLHWGLFFGLLLLIGVPGIGNVINELLGRRPFWLLNVIATVVAALIVGWLYHQREYQVLTRETSNRLAWRCVAYTWTIPLAGMAVALLFINDGYLIRLGRMAMMVGVGRIVTGVIVLTMFYYGLIRVGFWWYANRQARAVN